MNISKIELNSPYFSKPFFVRNFSPSFRQTEDLDVFVKQANLSSNISDKEAIKSALPEYLYHLTNKENYKKIIRTGVINPSKDIIDGVFFFDMDDFQNNWRKTPNMRKSQSLAAELTEQALKGEQGLVLIRISTKNLNPLDFVIRVQDEVLPFIASDHFRNLHQVYAEKGGVFNYKFELPQNLVQGYSPVDAKKYIEEGRPIEYVYKNSIDIASSGMQKVIEYPNMKRQTLWGYGIKQKDELFESFKSCEK